MKEIIYFKCRVCGKNCAYEANDALCFQHTKDPDRIRLFKERKLKKGTKYMLSKIKEKESPKIIGASLMSGYKGFKHHFVGKRNKRSKLK